MRKRLFRLRRMAVAALTSATVVGGMTVIGAGTASAAVTYVPSAKVGAAAPTTVTSSGSDQAASNLIGQFDNTFATNDVMTFQVADHGGNNCSSAAASIGFSAAPTVNIVADGTNTGDTTPTWSSALSSTGAGCSGLGVDDTLTITITNSAGGTTTDLWDVTVSGIHYNVGQSVANGTVTITADGQASNVAGDGTLSTPSDTSKVANMDVESFAGSVQVGAKDSWATYVLAPGASQPAADLQASFDNTFASGQFITFQVVDNNDENCGSGTETIAFAGTPTVTVTADPGNAGTGETTPTVTAAYSKSSGGCTTNNIKDILTLTITNSATGLTPGDRWNVDVSGIEYTVGATAANGSVGISADGNSYSWNTDDESGLRAPNNTPRDSNAVVSDVTVAANSTPVGIDLPDANPVATDVPVSDVTLTEAQAGAVTTGYACLSLGDSVFDTSGGVPTVSATPGDGVVMGAPSVIDNGAELVWNVTTASTTAATYTVSGIAIDNPSYNFNNAFVSVGTTLDNNGTYSWCTGGSEIPEDPAAFYAAETHHIYGATADDTAAAELAYKTSSAYPYQACVGNSVGDSVVLTRDDAPYDALAGAFLGGELNTGTLLTPGGLNGTVSNATMNAIRLEGVRTVYVLGGPGAISYPIVAELQSTPAYECGGVTQVTSGGNPVMLQVVRIWGNTADDTSGDIAQYFGTQNVGTGDFPAAYGAFNDTAGTQSLPPQSGDLNTAIVATDGGWQDATSAGPVAYYEGYPLVLTPQSGLGSAASSTLSNLGIGQVIVMGGPGAISDTVVAQIQSLGIPVLRIAGSDFTDTSQLTAQFIQQPNGLDTGDASPYLARGDYFSDALAGAADAGGRYNRLQPILLSQDSVTMGPGLVTYFTQAGTEDGAGGNLYPPSIFRILGGPGAFSEVLVSNILTTISAGQDTP